MENIEDISLDDSLGRMFLGFWSCEVKAIVASLADVLGSTPNSSHHAYDRAKLIDAVIPGASARNAAQSCRSDTSGYPFV